MQTAEQKEALNQLGNFTGTENYHRYTGGLVLTDGVKFLADNAGAYWLMDIIASYLPETRKDKSLVDFQIWHLRRGRYMKDTTDLLVYEKPEEEGEIMAHVVAERDTDDPAIVQEILYTDFPFDQLSEVKIYVGRQPLENGQTVFVAMLPSEY